MTETSGTGHLESGLPPGHHPLAEVGSASSCLPLNPLPWGRLLFLGAAPQAPTSPPRREKAASEVHSALGALQTGYFLPAVISLVGKTGPFPGALQGLKGANSQVRN